MKHERRKSANEDTGREDPRRKDTDSTQYSGYVMMEAKSAGSEERDGIGSVSWLPFFYLLFLLLLL